MASRSDFDTAAVLSFLGLPGDYDPTPAAAPIAFLTKHLRQLPSHILHRFSVITTPQQRTAVVLIRNRRFNFTQSNPPDLTFSVAKRRWPQLWEGTEGIRHEEAREEAREEKEWAETAFLGGVGQVFVGKLGTLLGGYEEARHLEHERQTRRARSDVLIPEEDESSADGSRPVTPEPEPVLAQDLQESFLRRVREQFIYGLLEVSVQRFHGNLACC
jgi:hypothetical protein